MIEDNEEAEYGYRSYGETEKEGQTDKVRWVYFRCWDAGVRLSRRSTSLATFASPTIRVSISHMRAANYIRSNLIPSIPQLPLFSFLSFESIAWIQRATIWFRELRNNLSIVITNDFSPKERNFDFYVSISTSMSNLDTYIPKSFSCSKCKWISLETLTSSRQSHLADCHTSHAARINEHRQSVPNENEFHF